LFIGFVLMHLACQMLLLVPALSDVRVVVRTAAFGVSLLFLVLIPGRFASKSPVRLYALCILAILGLELFHPQGEGGIAAIAEVVLNLAILAPIFWASRVAVSTATFQRVVVIFWFFYTASAALGVLQVYYPGRFQPALASVIAAAGRVRVEGLMIQLSSGERVFRPMGLTDSPGGAASGGMYAVLLSAGILLLPKAPFFGARMLAVGSMIVGLMCLYLCQVRVLVVMVGVCLITLLGTLVISGRGSKLLALVAAVGTVVPSAFMLAFALGGRSMADRLSTLTAADPGSVYYANRGHFLEATIDALPEYPLGAGLGRWGMINAYFGGTVRPLWVEIQWTGWLFDGGIPLVLVYFAAIVVVSSGCLKIALSRVAGGDSSLSLWAAVLLAYNVGTVAVCFNYPFFAGTAGLEFWLLNTMLLCAARNSEAGPLRSELVA
jgi:hypothetical protein